MKSKNEIQPYTTAWLSPERRQPNPAGYYPRVDLGGMPDLKAYWHIVRNRSRIILLIFLCVVVGVGVGTLVQTPIYRASAVLEIGKESPDIASVETLFKLENVSDVYLETQFGVLKSASLAGRVINDLHLDHVEEFNPPTPWWSWSRWAKSEPPAPSVVFQRVLARFQDGVTIMPTKGSRLVQVSFDSENPELAATIVNSLLSNYLHMRLESGQKGMTGLSQQLESTKEKLELSERDLQKYARKHGLLYLGSGQGTSESMTSEQLQQMQGELTKGQAALYEKEALYRLVQKSDYASLPSTAENKVLQDLTVRLADLRRECAMLEATFTPDYPKVKQVRSQIDELEAQLKQERGRTAARITNDYLAAQQRVELLGQAFQGQREEANSVAERSNRYNILKRDVETTRQLYDVLQQKLKEVGISATLRAGNAGIVDPAVPPRNPDRPKLRLNMALAIMLGLGLGVGAAFLQDYLDTSLKSSEEVSRFLDVPALGMIPAVESLDRLRLRPHRVFDVNRLLPARLVRSAEVSEPRWYRIDRDGRQYSALAEAFGTLRTSVLLNADQHPPRSLLVSSSQPGEGKTTISVNLAISLAQLGQTVLLVDADIRRSAVHKALGLPNDRGLVNYLSEEQDWMAIVQPSMVDGLKVLTAGKPAANPAELLSSWRMHSLMSQALVDYDFVLLDSPALLINAADARILAGLVEGVVLVVRSGTTPRDVVVRARAQVTNVIGVILNSLDVGMSPDYYRGYYGYDKRRDLR